MCVKYVVEFRVALEEGKPEPLIGATLKEEMLAPDGGVLLLSPEAEVAIRDFIIARLTAKNSFYHIFSLNNMKNGKEES